MDIPAVVEYVIFFRCFQAVVPEGGDRAHGHLMLMRVALCILKLHKRGPLLIKVWFFQGSTTARQLKRMALDIQTNALLLEEPLHRTAIEK